MELSFRALKPADVGAYLALFDQALGDFADWSGCYCGFYDTPGENWEADPSTAAQHRAAREARIRNGQASGVLAYAGQEVVGWCNAAQRSEYVNLRRYSRVPAIPNVSVGLVMCFVVLPSWRGRGVASGLLNAAEDLLRARGGAVAEAYPRAQGSSSLPWPAAYYKGPWTMYEKAGYAIESQQDGYLVVRKGLT
jgi:GNAT superfamily N-acetyltransferase